MLFLESGQPGAFPAWDPYAYQFGKGRMRLSLRGNPEGSFFIREQLAAGAHPFDKCLFQARPRCIKTGRQSSRPAADNDRIVNLAVCHKLEKTLSEGSAHAYRGRKEGI